MFRSQLKDNLQKHFSLQKYRLVIFMLRGKLPVSLLTAWLPSLSEEGFPNIKSWWQTVTADARCLQFQQQLYMHLQKPNLCFPCKLWRCTGQCNSDLTTPARRMAQVLMSSWMLPWVCCYKQTLLDKKNLLGIVSSGRSPKELTVWDLFTFLCSADWELGADVESQTTALNQLYIMSNPRLFNCSYQHHSWQSKKSGKMCALTLFQVPVMSFDPDRNLLNQDSDWQPSHNGYEFSSTHVTTKVSQCLSGRYLRSI